MYIIITYMASQSQQKDKLACNYCTIIMHTHYTHTNPLQTFSSEFFFINILQIGIHLLHLQPTLRLKIHLVDGLLLFIYFVSVFQSKTYWILFKILTVRKRFLKFSRRRYMLINDKSFLSNSHGALQCISLYFEHKSGTFYGRKYIFARH